VGQLHKVSLGNQVREPPLLYSAASLARSAHGGTVSTAGQLRHLREKEGWEGNWGA